MKTPRRGLKALRFLQITIQYPGRSRQAKRLQKLYSAVQYSLIRNILFLNLMTIPLGVGIKNIVLSLFDTIEYIYSRRNGQTF